MEHNQTIHFIAEFSMDEGKIEEYKKLIQEMSRMVEANEQCNYKRSMEYSTKHRR
jgi:hypothetical protein